MRGHAAANLGLFADYHGLEDSWVLEAEGAGYASILLGDRDSGEGRGEGV